MQLSWMKHRLVMDEIMTSDFPHAVGNGTP